MGFRSLNIKREYRSLSRNVVEEFYTPLLNEAVLYRRAVGFFSSTALISLLDGIKGLVSNHGRIEVIASPRLSEDDLLAIRDGFARRSDVIEACLLRELEVPKGRFEEARLNLLSNLIAAGILTIKIAFLDSGNEIGMYHEKLGLIVDEDEDTVAFSGSMNESANAFFQNYESIDVFTSWSSDADRVFDKVIAFNAMWNDCEPGIIVSEFPKVSAAIIDKYKVRDGVDTGDLDVPIEGGVPTGLFGQDSVGGNNSLGDANHNAPAVPRGLELRDYQLKAIKVWEEKRFRGIFDMATGTGKTITALSAISVLSERLNHKLAIIIVCPYQHLVEQWKEDAVSFGLRPIICHSASSQKNWKERVKTVAMGFELGAIERFCIITTNATFMTQFMQTQVKRLRGNCLLVVDEAHNLGTSRAIACLPAWFPYRLALSATIERYGDEEGTDSLYDYFGDKCIEYSLEDAINNCMLTPYYYHPVPVYLESDELERYMELSRQIGKAIAASSCNGKSDIPESIKMLLIKRARIIAGANAKISKLKEIIRPYSKKNHMLVYCGATTVQDAGYQEGMPDDYEIRQIDVVSRMLGSELNMKVAQFTSKETVEKREILKREFAEGRQMQALVAIRCLDEGVNIPSIDTAFILASGTNPKEYIQRRGRVLRKARGKKYAEIFDFVTLPMPINQVQRYPQDVVESSRSLAIREITRVRDFAGIAENPSESIELITSIVEAFSISEKDERTELYV